MFITISLNLESVRYDISVDNKHIINDAIDILISCGKYSGKNSNFYRSEINSKVVSGYFSFEEAGIFDGDLLSIIL